MSKAAVISGIAVIAALTTALWLNTRDTGNPPDEPYANLPSTRQPAGAEPVPAITAPSPVEPAAQLESGQSMKRPTEESIARANAALLADMRRQLAPEALAAYRKSLEEKYAGLGKALALPPEEVNRLIDLLVRRHKESVTESTESFARRISRNATEYGMAEEEELRLMRLNQKALEDELRIALGGKYDAWEAYIAAPSQRAVVGDLQNLLEISSIAPLTAAQVDSLVAALASERVRINRDPGLSMPLNPESGSARILEWNVQQLPEINRRLVQAASRYLNAQQLEAYRTMLDNDLKRAAAALRNTGGIQN